jgi:uncharacterized protein (TIGR02117 family)
VLLGAWAVSGETPAIDAPPARAGDCTVIGVWSNGFHTSLALGADQLPASHPIRALYPDQTYLLIGWGDLPFYRSMGNDMTLGVQALLPGGQSGLHVLASAVPVQRWYIGKEVLPVALSREGLAQLAQYITDSMALTADGAAKVAGFEQQGYFLEGQKDFHALNVCNHWTTRAMRAAGVPVNAALAFTGDAAIALIGWAAPSRCPS